MIIVPWAITADNTDLLSGTALAQIPGDGQLDIHVASTQNDTTLTLTGPGNEPLISAGKILLRSNGMPTMKDDPPYSVAVVQGGKYIVNIDIVTAATCAGFAIFRYASEL